MELQIRPYTADDIKAMVRIWNEVVEAGDAFPQVTPLTEQNADEFFSAQTATMVADVNGIIFGMYILHPNGIGRCAHIANASFAVASASRGLGLGRKLVENCIETCGKKEGLPRPAVQRRGRLQRGRPAPVRVHGLHESRHDPRWLHQRSRRL